jgi:hypothetical protein
MTAPASHFEITDLLHGSCGDCRKCAEDAAVNASVSGSVGATSSVERRDPSTDRLVVEHRATVRRVPEARVIVLHDPQTLALDDIRELLSHVGRTYVFNSELVDILRRFDLIKES